MQGSGIIDFEDGSYARVGFGGGNGYAYRRFVDYFSMSIIQSKIFNYLPCAFLRRSKWICFGTEKKWSKKN